jgi:hypothetical protein
MKKRLIVWLVVQVQVVLERIKDRYGVAEDEVETRVRDIRYGK